MSASDIMKELPGLTEAERQLLLEKLQELAHQGANISMRKETTAYSTVDLRSRGIGEAQAQDLRARLKTFSADWDRPEASIYDEDPAR